MYSFRKCHIKIHILFVLFCGTCLSQEYNYAEVLQKSMWFYEVQRSGELPENNRVEWRGSSAIDDGSDVGHDLSGGWYDAGDNMKFNFPMASSVTLLAWGALEYPEGYQKHGQWGWLLENIKWVTDYLVKCHTAKNEFYGQIGIGMTDHKWWGAPEVFPNERPAFKIDAQNPGSDLAAEAAAALASSSLLFRGNDEQYADKLLNHAKELYEFADTYRGLYHEAMPDVVDFYKSWSGYIDELVWGALWLFIATGDRAYLSKAEKMYDKLPKEPQSTVPKYKEALSWDDKTYGCYVLLAKITNKKQYHDDSQRWLDWWSYGYEERLNGKENWSRDEGVPYTPGGLAWIRQWGPIRYAVSVAFTSFVYSDCPDIPEQKRKLYYNWAKSQIDYALGNNEQNRSYVCGFGNNPPTKPHHRSMHGPYLDDNGRTPEKSRHVLYGALVGGPGQDGSYEDQRLDAVKNEVATDYNAGFSSALARLAMDYDCHALQNFPEPAARDTEYTVVAKINTQGDRFTEIAATVMNKTTWPARYSRNLKIRYFVNLSEIFEAGYDVTDVNVEFRYCHLCSDTLNVSQLKRYNGSEDVYYTEISFDKELIFPGGQSAYRREVQFRISLPETAPQNIWDPSNDPSFEGLTNMVDTSGCKNIPAYENGAIVWGVEPDGTRFELTTWQIPDLTEPQYKPSGWDPAVFNGVAVLEKPSMVKHKSKFTVGRKGKAFVINAFENIKVQLFNLDGKQVYSTAVSKGSSKQISPVMFSASSYIMKISGDAGMRSRHLRCLFLP